MRAGWRRKLLSGLLVLAMMIGQLSTLTSGGEVIISKQRSGPLGTVKLAWLSEFTTFANLAKEQGPGGDAPF